MNKAAIWKALCARAQLRVDEALAGLAAANRLLAEVQASQARLDRLGREYENRLRVSGWGDQSGAQLGLVRSYIGHLDRLQHKLVDSRRMALRGIDAARERYLAAEAERGKFARLAERELALHQQRRQRLEARELDRVATERFNRR